MESIRIKDQLVSRIGFGCCPMGQHGWGNLDGNELKNAVHKALDLGINFFDTADIYGLGLSEEILGSAIKGKRDSAFIATKFGERRKNDITYQDNSLSWLRTAVDFSLKRLGIDVIDLYQIHNWDRITPLTEVFQNLEDLVKDGKIRSYGISNINLGDHKISGVYENLVTCTHEFSLANQQGFDKIIDNLNKFNLNFLSWGSLGQGVLSGKYEEDVIFDEFDRRSRDIYINFHGEKLKKNLKIVSTIDSILKYYPGKTITQISLRWILDSIDKSIALVGIKRQQQILDAFGALDWELDADHKNLLNSISKN